LEIFSFKTVGQGDWKFLVLKQWISGLIAIFCFKVVDQWVISDFLSSNSGSAGD
jgi:hypothetical protein